MDNPINQSVLRLFIAVALPKELKEKLESLISIMQVESSQALRWQRPENLHITVKFLGDTGISKVDHLISALNSASMNHAPFEISLGQPDLYPNHKRPRVITMNVLDDAKRLAFLFESIENNLAEIGFPSETRPFRPHLTVGRISGGREILKLGSILETLKHLGDSVNTKITVHSIYLMQSILAPSGASYIQIGSAKLSEFNQKSPKAHQ